MFLNIKNSIDDAILISSTNRFSNDFKNNMSNVIKLTNNIFREIKKNIFKHSTLHIDINA